MLKLFLALVALSIASLPVWGADQASEPVSVSTYTDSTNEVVLNIAQQIQQSILID